MLKFNSYLIEAKNTHMEHVEDLIFNEGVNGTRKAINFLRDLRDMLAGHSRTQISRTVKWDGAPAVFVGVDPSDGKFFVANKGVFNKNPKVYKSVEDVKADTSGDLQAKLIQAFNSFSTLGVKSGVYQGDLMFTKGDLSKTKIDGVNYITFQPNTIMYAVPAGTPAARQLLAADIGIVWHTTYTGKSFETMSAAFAKNITSKFKQSPKIWQMDATYQDLSGNATFTVAETNQVTSILSQAGRIFNKIPAALLNEFSTNEELHMRTKTFNNTFVRQQKKINPKTHARLLSNYIIDYYKKEMSKRKTQAAKDKIAEKQKQALSVFTKYNASQIQLIFELMNLLVDAKQLIVDKMNHASNIGTFLKTRKGFKVTNQEGFVAIDHLTNDAVKIVDRMEFSYANFSPEVIKGWEK